MTKIPNGREEMPKKSVTIDIGNFIRMSNAEKDKLLESLPPEIRSKLFELVLEQTEQLSYEMLENNKQIKETEHKIKLIKHQNFDHSDIRLNTKKFWFEGRGCALAQCHDDHIEILCNSWISEFRFFENIMHSLNHEHLHGVTDRILLEDGFDLHKLDLEWMFYAGAMDELFGINSSLTAPNYYLSTDALRNSIMANKQSFDLFRHPKWDYDI